MPRSHLSLPSCVQRRSSPFSRQVRQSPYMSLPLTLRGRTGKKRESGGITTHCTSPSSLAPSLLRRTPPSPTSTASNDSPTSVMGLPTGNWRVMAWWGYRLERRDARR